MSNQLMKLELDKIETALAMAIAVLAVHHPESVALKACNHAIKSVDKVKDAI